MDWKYDTPAERAFGEYFIANASEDLKKRVAEQKKTPKGALSYVAGEARKLAKGNVACMTDEQAYGLMMHYFEDEDAAKWEGKPCGAKVTASANPSANAKPPAPPKPEPAQLTLF